MTFLQFRQPVLLAVMLMGMTACSGGWFGDSEDPPLPGTRYAVLPESSSIRADDALKEMPVSLTSAQSVQRWPQTGGNAFHYVAHPEGPNWAEGAWDVYSGGDAGDGEGWEMSLVPAPIVAGGKLFAMDAEGSVSAHTLEDGYHQIWQVRVEEVEGDALPGGGLAYSRGMVISATGSGVITALDEGNGVQTWQRPIGLPVRSSPTIAGDRVYITTVDNQLFVLSLDNGRLLWKHQGITEKAGVLSSSAVAVEGSMVLVPYSSGELYALQAENGREAWRETLARGSQTAGAARLVDVAVPPIIGPNYIYAANRGGVLTALNKRNGLRMWERDMPGIKGLWLSTRYLYLLTGDDQLVCLMAQDGRVRWVAPAEPEEDRAEDGAWFGPSLISGKLVLIGSTGTIALFNPENGQRELVDDIPGGIYHMPAIAQGALYVVTRDAELYAIR